MNTNPKNPLFIVLLKNVRLRKIRKSLSKISKLLQKICNNAKNIILSLIALPVVLMSLEAVKRKSIKQTLTRIRHPGVLSNDDPLYCTVE